MVDYQYVDQLQIKAYIQHLQKSSQNLIKVKNLFDIFGKNYFPCSQNNNKLCQNYLVEIDNFDKKENNNSNVTNILLTSGFKKNSNFGSAILYNFIKTIEKHYLNSSEIQNLLKNFRIYIYFNLNEERTNFTFQKQFQNLRKNSQIVSHKTIIKKLLTINLIQAVLNFETGEKKIIFPKHKKILLKPYQEIKTLLSYDFQSSKNLINNRTQKQIQNFMFQLQKEFQIFIITIQVGDVQSYSNSQILGNSFSIVKENSKYARFGDISNYINIIKKFMDFNRPYLKINKLQKNKFFEIILEIRGCIEINQLYVDDYEYHTQLLNHDNYKNSFQFKIIIKSKSKFINQVQFGFVCDKHWQDLDIQNKHLSYLVKSRIDNNFEVQKNNKLINSTNSQNYKLIDIRTAHLQHYKLYRQEDIFKMINFKELKAQKNNQQIKFILQDKFLLIESNFSLTDSFIQIGQKDSKFFVKFKYSNLNQLEINSQTFFEFIGRQIQIVDILTNQTIFDSFIQIHKNLFSQYLPLPLNGLTCSAKNQFQINIMSYQDSLIFELKINKKDQFSIKLDSELIQLDENINFVSDHIFKYYKILKNKNLEYSIRGKDLQLIQGRDKIFNCKLKIGQKFDSFDNEFKNQILENVQQTFYEQNMKLFVLISLSLVVMILILIKKNSFNYNKMIKEQLIIFNNNENNS